MMLSKKQIKPGVWVLELSGRVQMLSWPETLTP